jgi:alanyl aminopeptidase
MNQHRHGSATADDLLAALSTAADGDVTTPFRTFLLQPGLPNIDVRLRCEGERATLDLTQSRHLPLGAVGDPKAHSWQVPMCVRYRIADVVNEQCTLLTTSTASVALEQPGCPSWVMPNAGAAGYYVWQLEPARLQALVTKATSHLEVRERMSIVRSVSAGFDRGAIDFATALGALEALARDPHPAVAGAPMRVLGSAAHWLGDDPLREAIERRARKLYAPSAAKLGWTPRAGESPEISLLRRNVIAFVARLGNDPVMRKKARELTLRYLGVGSDGRVHRDAIDANLAGIAAFVSGEDADEALFDAMLQQLDSADDEVVRGNVLAGISAVRDPALAKRALDLMLHPLALKTNEITTPLYVQLNDHRTRAEAWKWLEANIDPLLAKLPGRGAGWLPSAAEVWCDDAGAAAAKALFEPRIARMAGGPRQLDNTLEAIRICAAKKARHLPNVRQTLR